MYVQYQGDVQFCDGYSLSGGMACHELCGSGIISCVEEIKYHGGIPLFVLRYTMSIVGGISGYREGYSVPLGYPSLVGDIHFCGGIPYLCEGIP